MTVLVTGSTGFLGRRLVHKLIEHNYQVRCLVRTPGRERIFERGSVDVYYGDLDNADALASACQGVEQVIHLVAVIRESGSATYDAINHLGVEQVLEAAKGAGSVSQFVHISAVGAVNDPSLPYLRSKWQGEQAVINSGLTYITIRPSLIFGEGDEFINSLAAAVRLFPVVPVIAGGRNRLQPIWVDDLAQCIALSLSRHDLHGHTLELGGPDQLSYNQIVDIISRTMNRRRLKVHVPIWIMKINVAMMEFFMSRPPINAEMLKMLRVRNVAELGMVEQTFGFRPRPMEGNIDFVNEVTLRDAMKINMGVVPTHIRDH
ncbi:MAG: complex I NDUFA9 subunit family protein [Chloroflexota bacterium]|nr:complex I NDUFA9 subunit family protein [Chloroflexota bacterium]